MFFVHANDQSGIVDQHINRFPFLRQGSQASRCSLTVTHIKRKHIAFCSIFFFQLLRQSFKLIHTTSIQNKFCTFRSKLAGTSFTNSTGCTGYQYNLVHFFRLLKFYVVKLNDFCNFVDRKHINKWIYSAK